MRSHVCVHMRLGVHMLPARWTCESASWCAWRTKHGSVMAEHETERALEQGLLTPKIFPMSAQHRTARCGTVHRYRLKSGPRSTHVLQGAGARPLSQPRTAHATQRRWGRSHGNPCLATPAPPRGRAPWSSSWRGRTPPTGGGLLLLLLFVLLQDLHFHPPAAQASATMRGPPLCRCRSSCQSTVRGQGGHRSPTTRRTPTSTQCGLASLRLVGLA